ncbi:unnamed protein product [Lactuca saligna]|uniref:F-box domain-containing protein n=1 Tax=Lactuca saligna TaxID=75948 RepID=A0AA35Y9X9_LACSI|nr:unnamed protein product [Lactuca saligna]
MSEYIPFEIQVDIIKRLPSKSLVRFRSVSKSWKSLIDSSEFIAGYSVRQTHQQRLLVWYKDAADSKKKYVSFVDDETFSQQDLAPAVPVLSKFLVDLEMVGSSQGLLCLRGYYEDPGHPRYKFPTEMAVLFNPCIRKSVCITMPSDLLSLGTVLGFGVCPTTNEPTIVKITDVCNDFGTEVRIILFRILGFTKNGKLIMETQDDYYIEGANLAFYEPNLEHINDIGINGKDGSLFVSSYKETLLLLDN